MLSTASSTTTTASPLWRRMLPVAAILLPWLCILAAHYVGNADQATGFIQYDQPYYVANGRAAFERGNGLLYPNPSDASENAPAIYFHWLPWLLGVMVTGMGLEPGSAYSLLNVCMLPVFGLLTFKLVQHRTTQHTVSLMLLAMWGGGVLTLLGLLRGAAIGLSLTDAVFEYDPTEGLWFLNWGRNTIYGIEITYHCLVAAAWLFLLKARHAAALLCAAVLALTHPWSGLELLLVVNAWFLFLAVRHRTGRSLLDLGVASLLISLLLGYYKVWLPGFPSHAALQANWSLNWRAEWSTILYAYGPVGILAALALMQQSWRLNRDEQFLLIAAAVAFGLSIHDRILSKSIQPLHFTRGYVWMPLFLLAIPQIVRLLNFAFQASVRRRRLMLSSFFFLACFDNTAFVATHSYWQFTATQPTGFFLTRDDRNVLHTLHHQVRNQVVFCESLDLSYLMSTYSAVRPWLGHKFNTPDYIQRQKHLHRAIVNNGIDDRLLPSPIQVLVLAADRDTTMLKESDQWHPVAEPNGSWQIWQRTEQRIAAEPSQRE